MLHAMCLTHSHGGGDMTHTHAVTHVSIHTQTNMLARTHSLTPTRTHTHTHTQSHAHIRRGCILDKHSDILFVFTFNIQINPWCSNQLLVFNGCCYTEVILT